MKTIALSKIHQNRIFIPKDIREILKITNGEKIIWKHDILNNLVIISKANETIRTRFQTVKKE